MRRILTTALVALTAGALLVFGSGAEEDGGGYLVRAAFDNGSFLVPGEVVRVAGADIGVIESTEISREDEIVALDPETCCATRRGCDNPARPPSGAGIERPFRGGSMEPMFLHEIEAATRQTPLFQSVSGERGGRVSQIFHLFAFKPQATRHLMRFTQEVMRGPSPLDPGWRELIAAFTSKRNDCPF